MNTQMETYRETLPRKNTRLTPVQHGIRRGLENLYYIDDLPGSARIDALMKRLAQKAGR